MVRVGLSRWQITRDPVYSDSGNQVFTIVIIEIGKWRLSFFPILQAQWISLFFLNEGHITGCVLKYMNYFQEDDGNSRDT